MLRQIHTLSVDHSPPHLEGETKVIEHTSQTPEFQWVLEIDGEVVGYSSAVRCLPKQNVVASAYALPTLGEGDHLFGCEFIVNSTLDWREVLGFHQYTRDAFVRERGFRSTIVHIRPDVPANYSVGAWVQQAIYNAVDDPFVTYLCNRLYFELSEFEDQSVWRWFNPR